MRDSILRWLTGSHGVHAETLMVVVGALAGFAPQNAAFRSIGPPDTPSNGAIYAAEAGGQRYYSATALTATSRSNAANTPIHCGAWSPGRR